MRFISLTYYIELLHPVTNTVSWMHAVNKMLRKIHIIQFRPNGCTFHLQVNQHIDENRSAITVAGPIVESYASAK